MEGRKISFGGILAISRSAYLCQHVAAVCWVINVKFPQH